MYFGQKQFIAYRWVHHQGWCCC